jgi:4'-phosphopantetheinyl transferase
LDLSRFLEEVRPFGVAPNGDELARAGRFRQPQQRRRFLTARAALRLLLGNYLAIDPADVSLTIGEHGKPVLAGQTPDRGLVFNISHSGDRALLAFAWNRAVGVDVERVRPLQHEDALAQRCLAPAELACWRELDKPERLSGLFRYWVCKEAFGKATGLGIQVGLASVEIAGDPPRLNSIPPVHGSADAWHLQLLDVAEGYLGCVCYNGEKGRLRIAP